MAGVRDWFVGVERDRSGVIGTEGWGWGVVWVVVEVAEALVVGQLENTHRARIQYRSRRIGIDRKRVIIGGHCGVRVRVGMFSAFGGFRDSGCWAFVWRSVGWRCLERGLASRRALGSRDINNRRYRRRGGSCWRRRTVARHHGRHEAGEMVEDLVCGCLLALVGFHKLLLLLLAVRHELLQHLRLSRH